MEHIKQYPKKKKECGHLRCGATCRLGKKPKKVYFLKRTPIKKKPYKLKRTRVKRVSDKRKEQNKIYSERREIFLKAHQNCECGRPECIDEITKQVRKSEDVHHKKGRGKYFLDESTWLAVARVCHQWIETHPLESKELGLSGSRLNKS